MSHVIAIFVLLKRRAAAPLWRCHSILVIAAILCCSGCGTLSEFETPLLPPGDPNVRLPELTNEVVDESDPHWATEPPRLDLFGDDCPPADVCEPIYTPPQSESKVPGYEVSGVSNRPSCEGCPACRPHPNMPWGRPHDEYICDGGDAGTRVRVRNNWQIDGLEMEDTIAHFDTVEGELGIVPSNRACIYAPRFAAVRQVTRAFQNQTNETALLERDLAAPEHEQASLEAAAVKQPIGTVRAVGTSIGTTMEEIQKGLLVDDVREPIEWKNRLLPFEDLQIVEYGVLARADIPTLLEGVAAAQVWSAVEMAQVVIDHELAFEQKGIGQAQAEVVYESPPGKPRLRLVKLASKCDAKAGDIIDFTVRFDNVGDSVIGNVTIVDKLTTRLEFVADSENCSVEADFSVEDASGDIVLRWEIDEPLRPGEGGVIRFQCELQ